MIELITVITLLIIAGFGYLIIVGFNLIEDKWISLGASFGLGAGIISLQLFLYSLIHISWNVNFLAIPWVGILMWLLFVKRVGLSFPKKIKLGSLECIFVSLIILGMVYTVFEALIRPPVAWDAWAIWLLKSKIFFIDGKVLPSVLAYLHSDYPLILSLLGTFVYLVIGHVDDTAILLISFTFFAFLALLFFAYLKKQIGVRGALIFTFFLVTIQNFVRLGGRLEAGQADLPLAYFIFICTILFFEYTKSFKFKTFLVLNIFLGLCCLVKLEGIPFSILIEILCLYEIHKKRLYGHLYAVFLWFLPVAAWHFYVVINHIPGVDFSKYPFIFSAKRIINVMKSILIEFINIKTWSLLWISYFYFLLFDSKRKFARYFILDFIIIFQLLVYLMLYLFVSVYTTESSLGRLLSQVAPLALLSVALKYKSLKNKSR